MVLLSSLTTPPTLAPPRRMETKKAARQNPAPIERPRDVPSHNHAAVAWRRCISGARVVGYWPVPGEWLSAGIDHRLASTIADHHIVHRADVQWTSNS